MRNEKDRLTTAQLYYGIRPSVTVPVEYSQPGTYSNYSGEIMSADFSVRAVFNEELSVRRS